MMLAFIELAASFEPPESPKRAVWADMWDDAQKLNGYGIDESRLVPAVVYGMRQAAHNLERAVALYGPDGPMAELFASQRKQLAELSGGIVSARGLTERLIRTATQAVREKRDGQPTRADVAAALHTSEATLKRAMQDLKMGPWPPSPPED